jgi:hypothetical protein
MVTTWVAAVETLALLVGNNLEATYTGFTFCLQNEWYYMQHVGAMQASRTGSVAW